MKENADFCMVTQALYGCRLIVCSCYRSLSLKITDFCLLKAA